MSEKHAEVGGAGLVGLSTALLLRRAGWSVTVHEEADAVREIGAGISLHQGACSVFEHLGLMDRILAAGVDLDASQALSHTGEVLADRALAGAYRQLAIRRQVLIKMLADEADAQGVEVLTNSRVTGATADGVLLLAGGKSRNADLVVGADGFHSAVRESVGLTDKKVQRSNGATRLLIDYDKASGRTVLEEWWGPATRMGIIPIGGGQTYVYMSSRESDRRATQVPIDPDYWGGLFPAVDKEIFQLLSQVQDARHDRYPYVKPKAWSKGRVAIVGDALNAVPPSLGLGATLGLRNARLMVDALGVHDSVPDALRAWEATARPDTEWIQRWSLFRERLSHNLPAPLARVRSKLLQRSNGFRGWGNRGRNFDEQLITGARR
ncbi:NAD(P)/FAD-dependent oxidoreductase [Nocardioides bigeumensis]|uniref:NAD(P)/FAD-dependent oxidoreductase n=1 Tax=Nocardioides bigeumensis TaxID=433657 RepID=A0ABN2XJQ9_9ACTN